MKKYLKAYRTEMEEKIDKGSKFGQPDLDLFKTKIEFFQHERLIHLLVTLFYAIFIMGFLFLSLEVPLFIIVVFLLGTILIFYVLHYFFLENQVQYLYELYDRMEKKKTNEKRKSDQ